VQSICQVGLHYKWYYFQYFGIRVISECLEASKFLDIFPKIRRAEDIFAWWQTEIISSHTTLRL
jgi:hypothetical protein